MDEDDILDDLDFPTEPLGSEPPYSPIHEPPKLPTKRPLETPHTKPAKKQHTTPCFSVFIPGPLTTFMKHFRTFLVKSLPNIDIQQATTLLEQAFLSVKFPKSSENAPGATPAFSSTSFADRSRHPPE